MRAQDEAARYTAKWHVTYMAGLRLLGAIGPVRLSSPSERMQVMGVIVNGASDLANEETAFAEGRKLDEVLSWLRNPLPMRAEGGTRRCILRIYTWSPDDEAQIAIDPKWITIGTGQSPNACHAMARRWLRSQLEATLKGFVSRELLATALEFTFWTAAYRTDYL